MALHFVAPDVEKTFGALTFGRFLGERTRRNADGSTTITRRYVLFSTVQVGDEIIVDLPGRVSKKGFAFLAPVRLVKPRIRAVGKVTGGNAHREFEMSAEDLLKV